MRLAQFVAGQLHYPSGLLGRVVLPRIFNRRNAALNDLTLECLTLQSYDRVLEVGFGGGYLLGRISAIVTEGFVAGVDISPEMVAFCRRRFRALIKESRIDLQCAGVEALPYPAGSFTKVCTVNTIFYWQDTLRGISELRRVLAEGGRLVICLTCKRFLEGKEFAQHGLALYGTEEVQELIETVGFRQIDVVHGADRHREFACVLGTKLSY